jgi:hypothetical protein
VDLDPTLVGSVMVEAGDAVPNHQVDAKAINVSRLDADRLDAVVRLVRLVETPAEAAFLAPLITWEIIYRLWMGDPPMRDVQRLREGALESAGR